VGLPLSPYESLLLDQGIRQIVAESRRLVEASRRTREASTLIRARSVALRQAVRCPVCLWPFAADQRANVVAYVSEERRTPSRTAWVHRHCVAAWVANRLREK
jgi:hypothetical protein